jgi:hypothetical protein
MSETKAELQAKRKVGRPRVYDPDIIAKELIEWAKDEESINMTGFCADRGYLPGLIWRLEQESQDFADAYTIAKMKLAERRERHLNADQLNYGAWQRYQRGYDPFLDRHERSIADEDASRKKGIVEQESMNLVTLAQMAAQGAISQKS